MIDTFNEMISRLDQSFRQVKQFTTDASHELKTPLTILKGEVEVGLRKKRLPHEYEQILESNLEEINRMSKIVEDLLLLSKADIGEIRLIKEDIDLTRFINGLIEQMKILALPKDIRIETSNHQQELHVLGDPLRMRELFINLIENGIKYTEDGGSILITLAKETDDLSTPLSPHIKRKEAFANITVTDTGIGIAKEDQEKIFNRFFRVDKARSREQGVDRRDVHDFPLDRVQEVAGGRHDLIRAAGFSQFPVVALVERAVLVQPHEELASGNRYARINGFPHASVLA